MTLIQEKRKEVNVSFCPSKLGQNETDIKYTEIYSKFKIILMVEKMVEINNGRIKLKVHRQRSHVTLVGVTEQQHSVQPVFALGTLDPILSCQ